MMLGRDVESALMAYADSVGTSHPVDPASHVTAAHAAWIASADDWTRRQKYPLASWLKNPEGALISATARSAPQSDGYRVVWRTKKVAP